MSDQKNEKNKNLVQRVIGFFADLFAFIKEWLTEDEARKAMLTDLGLPADSPPKLDIPQDSLDSIDRYRKSKNPDEAAFLEAVNDIKQLIAAIKAFIEAANAGGDAVLEEVSHRFFEIMTVSYLRLKMPALYWAAQAFGFVEESLSTHSTTKTYPERMVSLFKGIGDHFDKFVWGKLETEEQAKAASDLFLLPLAVALAHAGKIFGEERNFISDVLYGWEVLSDPLPLADQVSDRTLSILIPRSLDDPLNDFMTCTMMLVPRVHGGPAMLISFGGSGTVEEDISSFHFKFTLNAPSAIDFLFVHKSASTFAEKVLNPLGHPELEDGNLLGDIGMSLSIEAIKGSEKKEETPEESPNEEPVDIEETLAPFVIGISDRSRIEFGKLSLAAKVSMLGADLKLTAEDSALVIATAKDADGFVSNSISAKETRIAFKFGMGVSSEEGFYLDGGAGLRSILPIAKSLGPVHVQSLQLGLTPNTDQGASNLALELGATVNVKLGSVKASIDQIGFKVLLDFAKEDPNLGLANVSFGFKEPQGVGLEIDASSVSGGGYLFLDPSNHRYSGAIQLQFQKFMLSAIGILEPAPAGSSVPFSLIIVVSFDLVKPIIFGPGIKWTAFGGLLGLNRTADVKAFQTGLRNHALDPILFPENPVSEAPRLLASLGALFPSAADQFMIGVSAKFEWPTPTLLTAELGFIFEFPNPKRLIVVGQFRARLPRHDLAQVIINVDAVGSFNFDTGDVAIDATLYGSTILGHPLTGDGLLRMGRSETVFSLGGFHPRYKPPPGLPALQRLAVEFSEGKRLRLRAEAYVAITSNSLQFGAKAEAFVSFGGFSVEGHLGFDALFQSEYPEFVADVNCGITLKYRGYTLLSAQLDMTVSGYKPLHLQGKVTFEILGWDKSKSFNKTFFGDEPPPALPLTDPLPEIVLALRDGRNWSAEMPQEVSTLVTVRTRATPNVVLVHPLGEIAVRQRVAPLNLELVRFGQSRLAGDQRFAITDFSLNNESVQPAPVHDQFAAGQFLDLSETQRLSRPSLEPFEAGVRVAPTNIRFGGQIPGETGFTAVSSLDYETCIVGENGECLPEETPHQPSSVLVLNAAQLGPAARAGVRTTGASKYRTSGPTIQVQAPAYAVASVDDLAPADGGAVQKAVRYTSYTAAEQALQRQMRQQPNAQRKLQVVWKFELPKESA